MEEKMKVAEDTKDTLLKKAGTAFENVKEKVEVKAEELLKKAKESELAEKAKDKLGDLKEGTKELVNKVVDKFSAKK
jgi:protoporphyrinogen oxidase